MADDDEETTPVPERRRKGRDNPDRRLKREANDVTQFVKSLKAHELNEAEDALHDLKGQMRAEILGSDSYVPVFVLTLIIVIAIPLTQDHLIAGIVVTCLSVATLLLTVRRSHMQKRNLRRVNVIALLAGALAILAQVGASVRGETGGPLGAITSAMFALLLALSIPAMLRRVLLARKVTMNMLAGALAAYLLLGLFFASTFRFIATVTPDTPFFAQKQKANPPDYEYFSFITITTVGYGDLSPSSDAARAAAVAEAIIGQVFLVTIVARVVSHLGTERPPREQMREAIEEIEEIEEDEADKDDRDEREDGSGPPPP